MLIFPKTVPRLSKIQKLQKLLSDHEWHSTKELVCSIGHTFGEFIFQLRHEQHWDIERRKHPTAHYQHQYRLRDRRPF